jgi:hypothetical protein
MADGDAVTFTAEEVAAQIAEANKAIEANRDKVMDELKTLQRAFDGVDPAKYKELQAQVTDLTQQQKADKAGVTSDELQRMRAEIREDLEREYADLKASESTLSAKVRELQLDNQVKAEMGKAGARAERIDALYRLTSDRYDLTDDGVPMLKDRPGTQIGKYVSEDLLKEYPEFYNGSGSSGSGASKSAHVGGGATKTIAADDSSAFMANLEGIASGDVSLRE